MIHPNVREILDADKQFNRWQRPEIVPELERRFRKGEVAPAARDAELQVLERETFRAGWAAAIQALIDAGQIKLVVNG